MIPIPLLRLEAPLMSFGGVAIDYRGVTRPDGTLKIRTVSRWI